MRALRFSIGALAFLAAVAWAGVAQDKVQLAVKADVGQVAKYQLDLSIDIDAGGQKFNTTVKQVEKVTIKSVSPSGEIASVRETESQEVTLNGEKAPDDGEPDKPATVTVASDGSLIGYESDSAKDDESHLNQRIFAATSVIFQKTPVGVGDKWSFEYKDDEKLHTHAGKANFEVLAMEKVKDIDCVKVKMTFEESSGSPRFGGTSTVWIEKASGDAIKSEFELKNIPFGEMEGASANGKGTTERISGGTLKASQSTGTATAEPKKDKNIDETVKDYEKLAGVFTLYRKRDAGKDTIYLELREDQLDKMVLLQATAATGNSQQMVAGNPINDLVLKFSKIDDRIMLVRPNLGFRATPGTPTATSLQRSFADSYLEAYKIEAKQEDRKSVLINISDLFRGDIAQVSAALNSGGNPLAALLGGGGGFSQDRDKTFIVAMKAFPENIFVQTNYSFNKGGGGGGLAGLLGPDVMADPRNMVFKVNYNLSMLPMDNYVPRLFDPRVGYFTADYQDFNDPTHFDNQVRNILRWRLQKKNPGADLSEPVKPIVFWLDNAIPLEYRDAVRDGVLLWNKAFEKIGYKNAVVVNQMPDNADWDPSDMRYNVVRWVLSPADAYAVAQFRYSPLTGEILNASILVDGNMVRFTERERTNIVNPADYFQPKKAVHDHRVCRLQNEIQEQAAFGRLALDMLGGLVDVDEKTYMNTFIRHVVCHEMGHILGLRHNFISSTQLTFAQMGEASVVNQKGAASSVMEYTPFNLAALKKKGVDWWPASIGDYDYWVVKYGYMDTGARDSKDELAQLKQLASQTNSSGLAWQSDETADSLDPKITRFDLAKNPLDYWAKTLEVSRYMGMNLGSRLPKQGESYWTFTRDFNMLINLTARAASQCTRYIGASHLNGNFKGDPGQKPTIVAASLEEQKQALDLLNLYIFSERSFDFPKDYYTKFTSNPDAGIMESILAGSSDYPVLDQFAAIQGSALGTIFRSDVLNRVANNEFKAKGGNALKLTTLFNSVRANVWSELGSGKSISALRRRLQRTFLDRMIGMVTNPGDSAPQDAKMLAWSHLRSLKGSIEGARKSKAMDEYTRVHLAECAMRIGRALNAQQTIGGGSAPARNPLADLLGGG